LESLRSCEEDAAAYGRDMGGMGMVAEVLRNEVESLEEILEDMRRKIDEGEGEWVGSERVYLVGGRWATFL
jgi:hypothetical protein